MAATGGVSAPYLNARAIAGLDRARSAVAYGSLAAVVAVGSAIAVLSADPNSALVQDGGRGVPGWMVGPLSGVSSTHLTQAQFYLLIAAMGGAYLAVIALGGKLRARWLIGSVAVLHLAFLLAPPLLSTDVFNYIDYARLGALHGLDPYSHGPAAAPHDPVFAYTAWRHVASAYGPLFTIGSYPLAHLGVPAALWGFKALAALASLGCVALVWRIAKQLGRSPVTAAAIFGLNPLLLVWTVGGAHNDLLMLVLMLAGVSLALGARQAIGGATLVAAVAIKATAGLAIPFLLIASRRRWHVLGGVAVAAALLYAVSAIAFPGHPLGVFDVLSQQRKLTGFNSVPTELAKLFGMPRVTDGVRTVAIVALLTTLAWIAWRVWRGAHWVTACGWAMVAAVVTTTWFLPWYAVWPLAFAAVSRDRRLLVVTLGMQVFWLVNHVPNFTT
jgi:alpha-1,6-mannosyltransferase